ncbi:JAB domain-containing protein [Zunongwangia endophytica]|uniref:JAB domain-containing protein n=1 Tax=Zunongwangia endophytica TaxID=1808945 RepID=A0ABV8H4V1_9FLAO
MKKVFKISEIKLLDHLIINSEGIYLSFADEGTL